MPRTKDTQTLDLLQARTSTAPCVPAIREAVATWREQNYPGVTPTTRTLLNYWFHTDHRLRGNAPFRFNPAQRGAMETLVYLWEIARVRGAGELIQKYAVRQDLKLLQHDDFARYCVKMATGSGKTFVMALAALYHYFNATLEPNVENGDWCKTSLLIAPNIIVYERLQSDFEGGAIFKKFPMVPPELAMFFDFSVYTRGQSERAGSEGALYLTNIQQLYTRDVAAVGDDDPIGAMMGAMPSQSGDGEARSFKNRIIERVAGNGSPLLVMNDEAHHTHDEKLGWNEVIRELGEQSGGLGSQLDFTATPRHSAGNLFAWTIYDYPLKQAIIDGLVKTPVKGTTSGIKEQQSEIASVRYAPYLVAGVERWKEYREQLQPFEKKPLLFVMLNDTSEADEVGAFLREKYPGEFSGDKLLVIHTNRSGEISKKDLEIARETARTVDRADSQVNCIVSVLMLREGWDVSNVTVVVGLRPYTSKANILPEQAIGRGLRLMFRGQSGYKERVDVIGNAKFMEFVEDLEREEDLQFEKFELGRDKVTIQHIVPDLAKLEFDIAVPDLTPHLARVASLEAEILKLLPRYFDCPALPLKNLDEAAQSFNYEGVDILTQERLFEREYQIPEVQTAQEVISFYSKLIMADVKLPSQFSVLAPKVREFLEHKAFGESVDLSDAAVVKAIQHKLVRHVTLREFGKALREKVVQEVAPVLGGEARKISETPAFPWSRPVVTASKCVLNRVPCDNEFERRFAQFLEKAPDVARFSKLASHFGFSIKYTDAGANLRNYEPDFVAVDENGTHWILETKGQEDIHVAHKDRAAEFWCENATNLTGVSWRYLIVHQKAFENLAPDDFESLSLI